MLEPLARAVAKTGLFGPFGTGADATWLFLLLLGMAGLAWARRDSLKRALFGQESPHAYAILRIGFAALAFWQFASIAPYWRMIWSDEGLFDLHQIQARATALRGWDPEQGFYDLEAIFEFLTSGGSVLQFWASPNFVFGYMVTYLAVLVAWGLGWWSRTTGVLAWLLMHNAYNASTVFISGTDSVFRCFWFLLLFAPTGHALSIDAWRKRRRGITAEQLVPAWPRLLITWQLAVLYVSTGCVKTGPTWQRGEALYYALTNSRYYRFEGLAQELMGVIGVFPLRLLTWVTHWWEILFGLLLLGMALRFDERHRHEAWHQHEHAGRRLWLGRAALVTIWLCLWQLVGLALTRAFDDAPRRADGALLLANLGFGAIFPLGVLGWFALRRREVRGLADAPAADASAPTSMRGFPTWLTLANVHRWLLGRRLWLTLGVFFHVSLIVMMNLGLFPVIMLMTYVGYFRGDEVREALRKGRRALLRWRGRPEPEALPAVTQPWSSRFRSLAVGVLVYHCLAVGLKLAEQADAFGRWHRAADELALTDHWLRMTGTSQAWEMFSPDASRGSMYLKAVVVDAKEGKHELRNTAFHRSKVAFGYHRLAKIQTRVLKSASYREPYAHFYCREWALRKGKAPLRIEMWKAYTRAPAPQHLERRGPFNPGKLRVETTSLGEFECKGRGRVPPLTKERRGLQTSPEDQDREARRARARSESYAAKRERWRERAG